MRSATWGVCAAVICACGSQPGGGQGSVQQPPPTGPADAGTPPAGDKSVDFWKELVIVDSSVVLDARALSANGGAWSFRRQMEQLGSRHLAEGWLRTYRQTSLNGFAVEDRPGVEQLLASWPRDRDGSLDLAQAPFRLLAIVSRLDLTTSARGEARLIYGLYDRASGAPRRMTVGFEYSLPALGTTDDRAEWARRWHALGKLPFGDAYNAALQQLTDAFAHGSSLSQLRANEAQFGELWQLRQWVLDGGVLRLSPTPQTPDESLNGSARLAQLILDNADALRAGTAQIPAELQGGTSPSIGAWVFKGEPRIDEALRHAFAQQTCNGCHAQETFSMQGFFHVSPFKPVVPGGNGQDRVSVFLKRDDLPRRVSRMQELLR